MPHTLTRVLAECPQDHALAIQTAQDRDEELRQRTAATLGISYPEYPDVGRIVAHAATASKQPEDPLFCLGHAGIGPLVPERANSHRLPGLSAALRHGHFDHGQRRCGGMS